MNINDIAQMIDHSLLRPNLEEREMLEGIALARKYGCATVCVSPCDVERSSRLLLGSSVRVSTVIGFPHGSSASKTKAFEAETAVNDGASELDMVLAIGRLVSADFAYVERDIRAVIDAVRGAGVVVKIIFENCYLNRDQIVAACKISEGAGADYVKTSTGYGPAGASLDDVRLMGRSCSAAVAVKAAGGIRTLDDLLAFRAAGAKMIGTRSTATILEAAVLREANGTLKLTGSS